MNFTARAAVALAVTETGISPSETYKLPVASWRESGKHDSDDM